MNKLKNNIIIKILMPVLLCMGVPIVFNKFLLSPIIKNIWLDGYDYFLRYTLGPLILMSISYKFYFKYFEKKKVLELKRLLKDGMLGILIGIVAIGSVILLQYLLGTMKIVGINNGMSIVSILLMILALAYTEEMLFRGILLRFLNERYGLIGLVITSVLFSILHVGNENFTFISFISVAMGGLLMGCLYLRSRNLFLPTGFHFAWNYVQLLFGLNLSGATELKDGALFMTEVNGPNWLTGGAFGPENSIMAILVCAILSFVVLKKKDDLYTEDIAVTVNIF